MAHPTQAGDPATSQTDTFRGCASVATAADAEQVWALVSDLTNSPRWSPECTGGRWTTGGPGEVGSVFRGENHREPDVVGWAPVVRGAWTTEMEVVAAERPRTFSWAMRDSSGTAQDSVWGFDVEPDDDGGTVLTHHFRMGRLTEGMRGIVSGMSPEQERRFYEEWGAKVDADLRVTAERIRGLLDS